MANMSSASSTSSSRRSAIPVPNAAATGAGATSTTPVRVRSVSVNSAASASAAATSSSNNNNSNNNSNSNNGNNGNTSLLTAASMPGEARKRAARRDAALRARFEKSLTKQRGVGSVSSSATAAVTGLKPNPAVTVRENQTVAEAARTMGGTRVDCVLVVDNVGILVGILTDKDISFRVVAEGKEPEKTIVHTVMTPNPSCVTPDTSATEALRKMLDGHFRHLPVVDDVHGVVGVLDITRCLYGAMDRMERAYQSSKVLLDAMETVEKEWSALDTDYFEALRDQMFCPPLSSALAGEDTPAEASLKTSVRECVKQMKAKKQTAILILDDGKIVGIFTTKDVVLRVVAAALDALSTAVIRVMTPNPDAARPDMTILDALKKMNAGHYLHLPVVDPASGALVGLADVLHLTYSTMSQLQRMGVGGTTGGNGNSHILPTQDAFSAFWDASAEDDRGSIAFDVRSDGTMEDDDQVSVSHASHQSSEHHMILAESFVYKLTDAKNNVHRFGCQTNFALLLENIRRKAPPPTGALGSEGAEDWHVVYIDDEDDRVKLGGNNDLIEAVSLAKRKGWTSLRLFMRPNTDAATDNNQQQPLKGLPPSSSASMSPYSSAAPPPPSQTASAAPLVTPLTAPSPNHVSSASPTQGLASTFLQKLTDPAYHAQNPAIVVSLAVLVTAVVTVSILTRQPPSQK